MSIRQETVSNTLQSKPVLSARLALVKVLILLACLVWAFWPQFSRFAETAFDAGDWAHALVTPVAIVILLLRRRSVLAEALTRGSVWGILLLLFAFSMVAVCTWPFRYTYVRDLAVIPAFAGVVLAICGWRVLKRCLPMLLLLLLSIPINPRAWESLIIRPDTYTIAAAGAVLDQLPGVDVDRDGSDLLFSTTSGRSGAVALAEPRRGASLLVTYVVIGVFVVFVRIRPFWQVAVMAIVAAPLALLCSLLRLVCWGVVSVYLDSDPASPVPRAVAAIVSLLLAYFFFVVGCWILSHVVVESDEGDAAEAPIDAARELMSQNRPTAVRSILSPCFLICLVIITASAIWLRPVMMGIAERFAKEGIGLRRSFSEFDPAVLESFEVDTARGQPVMPYGEMGTDEVLFYYLKEKRPGPKPPMALIFATYYCDPTYPIAHTPDVCCRQVGYTVSNMHTDTIDLSALGPEHANTEISVLDIERGGERLVVTFVLRADDKFCHTRDQARLLLSDPSDKYWYFSKIEAHAAFVTEEDRPLAEATAKKILTEVVPVLVEEYFPRTDDLKQP